MAKFAKWNNPIEMARDLKRGLYQLTFKDNMPNEPVTYQWRPDIRSTEGTSFTINSSLGNAPTYSIVGNRCFFKISSLHLGISGNAQSVFWLRLPVPAKSLTEGRWMGYMFCPYPDAILVNALVYPNEWWLRLEAHSQIASIGSFPRTTNAILVINGDFEIHPAYLRTGTLQEREVPFDSYAIASTQSWVPTITGNGGTVDSYEIWDASYLPFSGVTFVSFRIRAYSTLGTTTGIDITWPKAPRTEPLIGYIGRRPVWFQDSAGASGACAATLNHIVPVLGGTLEHPVPVGGDCIYEGSFHYESVI